MRDATKDDYYWNRAMEEAVRSGFKEFAMTLNPFPGAVEHTVKLARMAKQHGFEVINITATHHSFFDKEGNWIRESNDLVDIANIITISVDDQRFDNWGEAYTLISNMDDVLSDESGFYSHGKFNINLLWTPKVFEWFESSCMDDDFESILEWREDQVGITVQHLIYKPLSLYGSEEKFLESYNNVLQNADFIKIGGNGKDQVGDVAFGNRLGMNQCPGRYMVDIDPMGFVRKCPENPDSFDATNIAKLKKFLDYGVPGCDASKCNCI
jgi:hypothetical protein